MAKDAATPGSSKASLQLASFHPECFLNLATAAFRSRDTKEETWDFVATKLFDGYEIRKLTQLETRPFNENCIWLRKNQRGGQSTNSSENVHLNDQNNSEIDFDNEVSARAIAAAPNLTSISFFDNGKIYRRAIRVKRKAILWNLTSSN